MPAYLLIANPVAGKGTARDRAEKLRSLLARTHRTELVETAGRGDATELARTRGADVDRVIAVGGDGTLNEVLTGLMEVGGSAEARPALGFLPGGTANVATAAFGFAADPAELARRLESAEGRLVDVGLAELRGSERPFLLWCGAGLDAVVIDELNSARTGHMGIAGLAVSAPRVLGAMVRYPAPEIHIDADGAELSPAKSVILANVGEIAFGGTVHAGASPFDGELDVVTMRSVSGLALLTAGIRMMASSLTASSRVQHRAARTVRLRGDGHVPVQIDGEPVGHLPLSVRLRAGAIRLLVE